MDQIKRIDLTLGQYAEDLTSTEQQALAEFLTGMGGVELVDYDPQPEDIGPHWRN